MISGGVLQSTPLCTRDQVLAALSTRGENVTSTREALIDQFIEEESAAITSYLGTHTAKALRVEEYELRPGTKLVVLHARPVDLGATFALRVGGYPAALDDAGDLERGLDFSVDAAAGVIRLLGSASAPVGGSLASAGGRVVSAHAPLAARVTYTAGYVDPNSPGMAPVWLRRAAELQVVYRLQRIDSLGGTVQRAQGGAASFEESFGLQREVRRLLDSHRRGGVAA